MRLGFIKAVEKSLNNAKNKGSDIIILNKMQFNIDYVLTLMKNQGYKFIDEIAYKVIEGEFAEKLPQIKETIWDKEKKSLKVTLK